MNASKRRRRRRRDRERFKKQPFFVAVCGCAECCVSTCRHPSSTSLHTAAGCRQVTPSRPGAPPRRQGAFRGSVHTYSWEGLTLLKRRWLMQLPHLRMGPLFKPSPPPSSPLPPPPPSSFLTPPASLPKESRSSTRRSERPAHSRAFPPRVLCMPSPGPPIQGHKHYRKQTCIGGSIEALRFGT